MSSKTSIADHQFVSSGYAPFNCMICSVCGEQPTEHSFERTRALVNYIEAYFPDVSSWPTGISADAGKLAARLINEADETVNDLEATDE